MFFTLIEKYHRKEIDNYYGIYRSVLMRRQLQFSLKTYRKSTHLYLILYYKSLFNRLNIPIIMMIIKVWKELGP